MPAPSMADAAVVMDLLNGFRKSKALFALVQLGIPDCLDKYGALSATDVATKTAASPDGVQRLLATACSLGLLHSSDGKFQNTELSSKYLTSTSPVSLTGYVTHSDVLLYPLWGALQTSIQRGGPCWDNLIGSDSAGVWRNTYRNPEDQLRFMKGMHSFAALGAPAITAACDLSTRSRLIDLGGATGALSTAFCAAFPSLSAVVVDLPSIISLSQQYFTQPPYITDADVLARIQWLDADFFSQPSRIPPGDAFLLARIIHDWDEQHCIQLLRTVYEKLQAGGMLLLCEMLLDDDGMGPPSALLQSLNMLVGWQGRERSLKQYRQLLEPIGFVDVVAQRTGVYLDVIQAFKPA